jgi:hypothetical protein
VPGVELSTDIESDEVHVLGYCPNPKTLTSRRR